MKLNAGRPGSPRHTQNQTKSPSPESQERDRIERPALLPNRALGTGSRLGSDINVATLSFADKVAETAIL
ncbi:MAG TPA: hypothetical protein VK327_07490, partial [Candidatus Paceibacterota bacterium]|nr:hypothetical protein [Candidatus Paceibacterota bacterium]